MNPTGTNHHHDTNGSDMTTDSILPATESIGRRGLFRLGGLTAATALIVAACGKSEAGTLGRIGTPDGTAPVLPEAIVNDGVMLRTLAGIETSIAEAYMKIIDGGYLVKGSTTYPELGDLTALVTTFHEHHVDAATRYNALAVAAGAAAWECGNIRLQDAFITPIFDRVDKGAEATDSALAIEPSDDPLRDMANLVHTLESLSAESAQALVPVVQTPAIRSEAMSIGVRSGRQAAAVALRIHPGGYVPASAELAAAATTTVAETTAPAEGDAAPPQTDIPLPLAVPGQFGLLSPITYVGGLGDENGVRLKLNFETPSLNSYAYDYLVCS
ncbi:MAG: hypothetical protein ABMA25_16620 [Ilumatobacteraceae bacterium]